MSFARKVRRNQQRKHIAWLRKLEIAQVKAAREKDAAETTKPTGYERAS